MSALSRYFGDKDWSDVREVVSRRLHKRWGYRSSAEDIEDAVSDAMLDLLDYWVELESSIDLDDPARNWKWALWRATNTATTFLLQRFDESRREVSIDAGEDDDDEGNYLPRSVRLEDPSEGPEELALDAHERAQARKLLDALPEPELKAWLADYLSGTTETEQAQREGVHRKTIYERRKRGLNRLMVLAAAFGLVPVT